MVTPARKINSESQKLVEEASLAHTIDVARRFARKTAHDFNNIMAVIQGFAAIMQNRLQGDEANRNMAEQIEASAAEALKLTNWLSAFANSQATEQAELNLNEVVEQFLARCQAEKPPQVELVVELEDQLPVLLGDETQLEQVCRSLWQNAIEAMAGGGALRWQTSLVSHLPHFHRGREGEGSDSFLRLRVSDTGTGMDSETQRLMFEPFFTTKNGKARGLGLTLAYDIIHSHHGFIEVSTNPEAGTCIDVYFPAQASVSGQTAPQPETSKEQRGHKLLVVDDDDMIRLMLQQLLKGMGYDVMTAASGEDAVAAYQRSHQEVSAVILDMNLPGMGGLDTFQSLKELDEQVKVIVSTGDPYQQAVRELMAQGACGIVAKPFRTDHLAEVIKQALIN